MLRCNVACHIPYCSTQARCGSRSKVEPRKENTIMRTIDSLNDGLSFHPAPAHSPAPSRFGGTLRTYWDAMRDGLAAARVYHEMTSRGVPHDEAVRRVFDGHFDAR